VKGPRVAELKSEGLYLSRHYVYKFCSPTRGSFLVCIVRTLAPSCPVHA
jgi:hypothetical protein